MIYKYNSKVKTATMKNQNGRFEFAIERRVNRHGVIKKVIASDRSYTRGRDAYRGAVRQLGRS